MSRRSIATLAGLAVAAACVCPRFLAASLQKPDATRAPRAGAATAHAAPRKAPCPDRKGTSRAPAADLEPALPVVAPEPMLPGTADLVVAMSPELVVPSAPELAGAMLPDLMLLTAPEMALPRFGVLADAIGSELVVPSAMAWRRGSGRAPLIEEGRLFATVPPAPRGGDPADSLYRLARQHLNQGDYRQAADLFRALVDRFPDSKYAPDALYWNAFALYRRGGTGDLRRALAALDEQKKRYPNAGTLGDAEALATRINGQLARGGDAEAAEALAKAATELDAAAPAVEAVGAQVEAAAHMVEKAALASDKVAAKVGRKVIVDDDDRLPPQCAAQQEKQEMRIAALNALLQMDADQAVPVLRDVLKRRDECSASLRRKAVFVVSQKHSPETEDILLDAVHNDPDSGVRGQAVFWLSQVPGERSLKAIESVLRTSKDPSIQEKALFALSQHHSPEAAAELRRFVQDESAPEELRAKAIFMLGQVVPSPENAAFLRELYRKSNNPQVKEHILAAMMSLSDEASGRFLTEVALDPKESLEVRKKALFLASQSGRMTTAELGRLYNSSVPKDLKEPIIFALAQRKDGVDQLIEIARHETNPGFRSKAVFWLGQSKDPRAVKVLQEILSQ